MFLIAITLFSPNSLASENNTIPKRFPYNTVVIPAGRFKMGCTKEQEDCSGTDYRFIHEVKITQQFYMMETEVTSNLYDMVISLGETPSSYNRNHPENYITWMEAVQFANRLSVLEGFEQCYVIQDDFVYWPDKNCDGWRLPTEAEWEYAARANQNLKFAGSNDPNVVSWNSSNGGGDLHPVKQKSPNAFGLYDMSGNVSEWVWDWYADYPKSVQTDPTGPLEGEAHIKRGGGVNSESYNVRVALRGYNAPKGTTQAAFQSVFAKKSNYVNDEGFRLVRKY